MTLKNLKANKNYYSIKKHSNKYLAFGQHSNGIYYVTLWRDVFNDGSYLSIQNARTDTTLQGLYHWLEQYA